MRTIFTYFYYAYIYFAYIVVLIFDYCYLIILQRHPAILDHPKYVFLHPKYVFLLAFGGYSIIALLYFFVNRKRENKRLLLLSLFIIIFFSVFIFFIAYHFPGGPVLVAICAVLIVAYLWVLASERKTEDNFRGAKLAFIFGMILIILSLSNKFHMVKSTKRMFTNSSDYPEKIQKRDKHEYLNATLKLIKIDKDSITSAYEKEVYLATILTIVSQDSLLHVASNGILDIIHRNEFIKIPPKDQDTLLVNARKIDSIPDIAK
jgi:hypothetical protein